VPKEESTILKVCLVKFNKEIPREGVQPNNAEAILEQSKTKKRKLISKITLNERSTEECPEAG
jgi:hypothetical protein